MTNKFSRNSFNRLGRTDGRTRGKIWPTRYDFTVYISWKWSI